MSIYSLANETLNNLDYVIMVITTITMFITVKRWLDR